MKKVIYNSIARVSAHTVILRPGHFKNFKNFFKKNSNFYQKFSKNFKNSIQKETDMAGLSFKDQVNTRDYFSLSHIDPEMMREHGLTMTAKALRELARKTLPAGEIFTGNSIYPKQQKLVKFWRYDDFKDIECGA